jgi:Holliday junction resolvase
MTEKEIERRMVKLVRERGGLTYKFTSPNAPGVPDRIIITPAGVVWFVELKTTIGRMANIQKWQKEQLEKQGANVRVIRGWDAAKDFINEVLGHGI